MLADCHMHTALCGHAAGTPRQYVRQALRQGLDLITFTCHAPMEAEHIFHGRGIRMAMADLPRYYEMVADARQLGREHGLEVLCGIEAEYYPDESLLEDLWKRLQAEPFDFVLGSLHHQLNGFRQWLLRQGSAREIAAAYFDLVTRAIHTGRYDSIAHPDLIRIYGTIPPFDPGEQEVPIRRMLAAAAETGTCLEVNTSGLIKELFEVHPAPDILIWAQAEGVELTLGSDSHRPEQVGQHFGEALELLRAIGFNQLHYFRGRKKIAYPI